MHRIAAQTSFTNYAIFLIAALTLAGVEAVGLDIGIGVSIIAYGLLALFSHRMVLLRELFGWVGSTKLAPGERLPIWSFLWRCAVLAVGWRRQCPISRFDLSISDIFPTRNCPARMR